MIESCPEDTFRFIPPSIVCQFGRLSHFCHVSFFFELWPSHDPFWLGLLGCLSFEWLGFWFDPIKDWFNACGVGECSATFSGHPFVSLKGELFLFPILI